MGKAVKLFIVEGEKKERRFVAEMTNCYMKGKYEAEIITVPAAQNIYMLYEALREDEYIDVVELLKEQNEEAGRQLAQISRQDIAEVYMFFDFDIQEDNLKKDDSFESKVVRDMLRFFDNETENGKLYISYPMSEALYDYRDDLCEAFYKCFVPLNELTEYKKLSGEDNSNASKHFYHNSWKMIIDIFSMRLKCLLGVEQLSYRIYKSTYDPAYIYDKEVEVCKSKGVVFVLSAFPEFLLDYFKKDFWNTMVKSKVSRYEYCAKEQ